MPAPSTTSRESARLWARRNYRKQAGWPDHALDMPAETRTNRDGVYHATVAQVYANPSLTSAEIGKSLNVASHVVRNALKSRHTSMGELRLEALEEVRL